eukprot:CAMPEP_0182816536 /NCGR_PEP_ID=MMETSP0006_2-20121128/10989_1 /TAXON_ID=97485 /ORGANISM="Prymnesium parvum, Strain Texoma1" /LENGTH=131 /DNA_ID=CAMNT_0024942833 /DNA_START=29 /DNA_END=424 /DNA_ORIENTATION=-
MAALLPLLFALLPTCSAFMVTPVVPQRMPVVRTAPATVQMAIEPSAVDAASQMLAMQIPIPAYTFSKAFIMIFSNVLIISTMSIDGKGLSRGTSHDEMVESFGISWLLSGTALGHIVGAGAILGCQTAGIL